MKVFHFLVQREDLIRASFISSSQDSPTILGRFPTPTSEHYLDQFTLDKSIIIIVISKVHEDPKLVNDI